MIAKNKNDCILSISGPLGATATDAGGHSGLGRLSFLDAPKLEELLNWRPCAPPSASVCGFKFQRHAASACRFFNFIPVGIFYCKKN